MECRGILINYPYICVSEFYNDSNKLKSFMKSLNLDVHNYKFVYGIYNKDSDKWYVGQSNTLINRFFNMYGDGHLELYDHDPKKSKLKGRLEDNYLFILDFLSKYDSSSLDDIEAYYIDKLESYNDGYNISKSGTGLGQVAGWNLDTHLYHNPQTKVQKYIKLGDPIPEGFILGKLPESKIGGDHSSGTWYVYSYEHNAIWHMHPLDIYKWIKDHPNHDLRWGRPRASKWNDPSWTNSPIITLENIYSWLSESDKQKVKEM